MVVFNFLSRFAKWNMTSISLQNYITMFFGEENPFMMGMDRDYEVDGIKGFILTGKNGRSLQPSAANNVLYNTPFSELCTQ